MPHFFLLIFYEILYFVFYIHLYIVHISICTSICTFYLYYWVFLSFLGLEKLLPSKSLCSTCIYHSQFISKSNIYISTSLSTSVLFFPSKLLLSKSLCLELVFSKCMWNQIGNLKITYKSINFIVLTTWLFSLNLWSTIILFVYCMLVWEALGQQGDQTSPS